MLAGGRQQGTGAATAPDAAAAGSNPAIDLPGFATDDSAVADEHLCAVCLEPAVPHVLLGCGHPLCDACSKRVNRCPTCRAAITQRTPYHAHTQAILAAVRYRCTKTAGCGFVGGRDAARQHTQCNTRAIRLRALAPQLSFAAVEAAVRACPEGSDESALADAVLALLPAAAADARSPAATATAATSPHEAARSRSASAGSDTPPQHATTDDASSTGSDEPHPHARRGPAAEAAAALLWDFDNVRPEQLRGVATTRFFPAMLRHLREELGVRVRDSTAYLVAGTDYGVAPEKLTALQVKMRLSGRKREAADRDMAEDLRRLARDPAAPRTVVIVSSDQDFIREAKELADAGRRVVVVHAARPGSDHAAALALWVDATVHVDAFAPAAPAAARARGEDDGSTVPVEGARVPVAHLVPNAMLAHVRSHAGAEGRWCTNAAPHDAAACRFAHCAVGVVRVEQRGTRAAADFADNAGLRYLLAHPTRTGRMCTNRDAAHAAATCTYLHAAAAAPARAGAVPPLPAAARPPPGSVLVDGVATPVAALARNAALNYLLAHPTKSGKLCRYDGKPAPPQHDVEACTFVHRRHC